MAYRVDYAEVEVHVDDFNKGEQEYVNTWNISSIEGNVYDTMQDLLDAIENESYCFTSDIDDYIYIDGRIDTDALVNNDNMKADEDEKEQWRSGDLTLYNAHLFCGISVISESHELTEYEAEELGFMLG